MQITLADAKHQGMKVLRAGLVPHYISSPGLGKSSIAAEIAQENNLLLIDVRLSQMLPEDLNGFPFRDDKTGKAGYLPMDIFPTEDDPLPQGYKGWLLLFDELGSALPSVQVAAYKIILDKMVGNHRLHKKCAIMAAGNLSTDKAVVNRISTALQSRMIWLEIRYDAKVFLNWCDRAGIDHRVKSYIAFSPESGHKFDPNHNEHTFPCPRTWEFVSRIIKPIEKVTLDDLPVIAGTVGEGMARQFVAYCEIYKEIPTIEAIRKNPLHVSFGGAPSVQYALAGLVGHHMTAADATNLMQFVCRLNIEFQVMVLRAAIARDQTIQKSQGVRDWIRAHAKELANATVH